MKRFEFKLQKALGWRSLQERLALRELEKLHTELATLNSQSEGLILSRDQAGRDLIASGSATGTELAFLDCFRQTATAELSRVDSQRADCRRRIEAQMALVLERRRELRMLERLKEQRLTQWHTDLGRELDAQASESYLGRWSLAR